MATVSSCGLPMPANGTVARLADSWVHPKFVLLSLRGEGRRHARVAIAADALPAEAFRRLRVWLRLRTAAG